MTECDEAYYAWVTWLAGLSVTPKQQSIVDRILANARRRS